MKTVTGRDIIEAARKNGYDHVRGRWFTYNYEGQITGACILGQVAINLGVVPSYLEANLNRLLIGHQPIATYIEHLNDSPISEFSYEALVRKLEQVLSSYLNTEFNLPEKEFYLATEELV